MESNNQTFRQESARRVEFTTGRILTILTMSVFIPCIMAGNSLVIAAVYKTRQLRSVTNIFMTSLAVTDGLVGALCLPLYMAFTVTEIENAEIHQSFKGLDTITGVTLIVHLMDISIDRYTCVQYPFTYSKIMSRTKCVVLIAFGWLYGIFNYSLSFIPNLSPITRMLILMIIAYFLPLCLIIAAYVSIARVAGKQARRIKGLANDNKSTLTSFLKEVKAASVLAVVITAFILCWSGTFIMNLKFVICRHCSSCDCAVPTQQAINAVKMLQYSSSLLDPLIYTSLNKDFRKAIKKILCARARNSGRFVNSTNSMNTRSLRFATHNCGVYEEMKLRTRPN